MSFNVIATPFFKKLIKRQLKKYPSLKTELQLLINVLKNKPDLGIHLGQGIYKIRLAIASKGKGKSGSARVITYLLTKDKEVYLVYMYDKSQLENITTDTIVEIIKKAGLNQ